MQGGLILVPTLFVIFYYELPDIGLIGERIRPGSLILAAMVGVPAAVVFSGLNNLLIYMLASAGLPPASRHITNRQICQPAHRQQLARGCAGHPDQCPGTRGG